VNVRDAELAREHRLSVRVRGVTTGSTIFMAEVESSGVTMPTRSSWYCVETSLQLNVPAGPYYVEAVVRHRADGREISSGPGTYLDVLHHAPFEGPVQLNMECRVTHAEEYGEWRASESRAREPREHDRVSDAS